MDKQNVYYSVITEWADTPFTTQDFPLMNTALTEYYFRRSLQLHSNGAIISVRVLRVSRHNILDITPGRED